MSDSSNVSVLKQQESEKEFSGDTFLPETKNVGDQDFKFSASPNFEDIRILVNEFAKERNWDKYHTPRNLLLAMVGEVGELAELFQWRGEVVEGLQDWTEEEKKHLEEELSDVLIYLLRLSEKCHVDLPSAVTRKMSLNEEKYPAFKVWGSNKNFEPARLAYNTFEPDTGADEKSAPIIYLHGLTASKENWKNIPQAVANATKRKSYSVDARNHGDSEWSDHFNFDANVYDLIHFMDTLDIQKAVLVGHSMGGITAIHAALKRPDRVEAIVVEDMMVRKCPKEIIAMMPGFLKLYREAVERIPPGLSENEMRESISKFLYANLSPEIVEYMNSQERDPARDIDFSLMRRDADGRLHLKCNVDAIYECVSSYETLVSDPEGVFLGPAFFVYGTLSFLKVGDEKESIKQFFPNAVIQGVEGDHSIHTPDPAKFTELLLKFLS